LRAESVGDAIANGSVLCAGSAAVICAAVLILFLPWCCCCHCRGKTNFFEKRVGEYQKSGVMAGLQVGGAVLGQV
jgi:hypothetical protein